MERILVLGKDPETHGMSARVLGPPGYHVRCASSEGDLKCSTGADFDALLIEIPTPGLDHVEFLTRMHAENPAIVSVAIVARSEPAVVMEAVMIGVRDFVIKPVEPHGLLGVVQRALREKRYERLRALNYQKGEFISLMVHELRGSLAVISAYTELLANELPAEQKSLLDPICRAVTRLDSITRSLTLPSFVKADAPEPPVEQFCLPELLAGVVNQFADLTQDKGQSVQTCCSDQATYVSGNPARVRIVLENLLDNAIRFTPVGGSITVTAMAADHGICVTVSDSGPGIPEEDLEAIFRPFSRLDTAQEGQSRLGLGLALSRRIVEREGGRIWVESSMGHGSKFHFTLPNYRPSAVRNELS